MVDETYNKLGRIFYMYRKTGCRIEGQVLKNNIIKLEELTTRLPHASIYHFLDSSIVLCYTYETTTLLTTEQSSFLYEGFLCSIFFLFPKVAIVCITI